MEFSRVTYFASLLVGRYRLVRVECFAGYLFRVSPGMKVSGWVGLKVSRVIYFAGHSSHRSLILRLFRYNGLEFNFCETLFCITFRVMPWKIRQLSSVEFSLGIYFASHLP